MQVDWEDGSDAPHAGPRRTWSGKKIRLEIHFIITNAKFPPDIVPAKKLTPLLGRTFTRRRRCESSYQVPMVEGLAN